ncbi:unnamed protein product (macronuclear) [Paramecium tetraurelia]|uniref:Peptidase A1 domain-containing protein n=1 Tax=Paramecium tetraurelia TaxID=5888 RepID=A0DXW3_PARTE|nr:uncharacterized protein GSPATT00021504001 [Paramecium tetraurelia]CAK87880.1 unnamed protein product [Paramecium tetraurelia]|eukprot:XP_001455277.1 hypothetical protein (macronuclear) [Paramecium tetraurelia strain d4-2]
MIIPLLLLFPITNAYFEQKLTRNVYQYQQFKINEKVTAIAPKKCPSDLLNYTHSDTYVSQICFNKNVFYNVEVILGDNVTRNNTFQLALDLTSPWTWYKQKDCISCKKINPLEYEIDDECKRNSKNNNCFNEQFNKSFNAAKWNDIKVHGQIYSQNSLIQGTFQTDTIQMLAYNSSSKMTISQYIAYEWGNSTPPSLVSITGLQMLQVQYINNELPILADGVIGFGFGYTETDDEKTKSDADFVEKLVQEKTKLNLTKQLFALYTYESAVNFSEMVVQVGGIDEKYIRKQKSNGTWIDRLEKSGYYWMVEINKIELKNSEGRDIINTELPIKKAFFTLNSQFIELPYDMMKVLTQNLQQFHSNTACDLVDSDMYILYCKNLPKSIQADYILTFTFGNNQISINNSNHLYRECNSSSEDNRIWDCLFNIKFSQSEYVILGEPFMKNHYIVFENAPGNNTRKIGVFQAATHMYYPDNPNQYEWPLFNAILFIFIFGLISVCSITFLKSLCKDIFRSFKYRKAQNPEDQQSLRISKDIDYVDYSTQEEVQSQIKNIEMSDQRKIEEWNKQQDQFKFGEQFTNSLESNSL